jgi:hypothetical protein
MMGKVTTLNFFAALPGRVTTDDRLTGLHFRILATIAGHDRMGRNGQSCWLGRDKLAIRVGCNPTNLSTAISDLISWGYLEAEQSEQDKRRKGFRVVYVAKDDAAGIGAKLKEYELPAGNVVSLQNTLPESDVFDERHADKNKQNQMVREFRAEPNIFGRNQDIAQKRGFGMGASSERKRYGAATHEPLARLFGNDGWEVLSTLPEDELKWLQRKYSDGILCADDLMHARYAARNGKVAAHG